MGPNNFPNHLEWAWLGVKLVVSTVSHCFMDSKTYKNVLAASNMLGVMGKASLILLSSRTVFIFSKCIILLLRSKLWTYLFRTSNDLLWSVHLFAHSIRGHWMSFLPKFPAKKSPTNECVIFAHSKVEHWVSQHGMLINMNTTNKD